jgi:arylsulfatase A-like enzyme
MPRPNLLLILLDDYGWMDTGCYGSSFYETPNLDRLAARGMRFTDAYAACPVCSPTRASLMSGKYPANVGVTDWIDWHGHCHPCRGRLVDAPYVEHLPATETSVATALREGGYATWHVGKWHLGRETHFPERHGFDVNVAGCMWGCPIKGYFSPWQIPNYPDDGSQGEYLTDRMTDEAIRLVRRHDQHRPFFLNLWHYAVHTPIQAKAEDVARFREKARQMGLDRITPLVPGEHFPTAQKQRQRVQRRLLQSDPTYAAMVWNMDWNLGRLFTALEETGQLDNTLILFTSDNGGLATAEGSPTSNLPLNEGKGWMYEGGTREPLIAAWPGVIAPGSVCSVPVTSPDFYPTLLAAAGLPLRPAQHQDGVSFLPLLQGATSLDREALFWHYPHYGNQGGTPGSSIRAGDWKLIEFFEDGRLELYHLRDDVGELRNLAAHEPQRVRQLHAQLRAWRDRMNAKYPLPNPAHVPWHDADSP